jgi:hypothetical protein
LAADVAGFVVVDILEEQHELFPSHLSMLVHIFLHTNKMTAMSGLILHL